MDRNTLIQEINTLLAIEKFNDYAPNGLQVSGTGDIFHVATAVTACQQTIDQAATLGADILLVHHGFFWKGEDPCIVGIKKKRIQTLLSHNINLAGYHLPLDAHLALGNNAELARLLDFEIQGCFDNGYIFYGKLKTPLSVDALRQKIYQTLQQEPLVIQANEKNINSIVWCTGGAQKYINEAADFGADAYLSGEISENTVHIARERNIHYFACGHHATERYGIQALGKYLENEFSLKHTYIEIDNPV